MILGVDVGGTFTDFFLLEDSGRIRVHKRLSSQDDPAVAIVQGISELTVGSGATLVHGTTVATNALLERRGARTALITTLGFGDVLEIGRQTRPNLYALHPARPEPLIPAECRFELPERVAPRRGAGTDPDDRSVVLLPLDERATDLAVGQILEQHFDSVAVCMLFSFLFPAHERRVRDRIVALGGAIAPAVSLSSEVLPEFREYERASTTVINAYVTPIVGRYLASLEEQLEGRRLRIMQSNGGSISTEAARTQAARTALSGPAGGVVGAFELARLAGLDQVITFDMGGTSTDVSVCPGRIQETTEGRIAGLPLRLPIIDIHTVGAGGGSIARVDAGGALRVGPQSAGADPGPACYGRSDAKHATVTDANLLLGRLDERHFLGGAMRLDPLRSDECLRWLARGLGLTPEAAALGVLRVANSNMERAIRTVSVERGHDPRRFTLLAFGGAGPLHACELAASLNIPRVLIPPLPGVLSALGMVLADVVKDYSLTVMLPADTADPAAVDRLLSPLCSRACWDLGAEGLPTEAMQLQPALDMRYEGQSYEITVPLPNGYSARGIPPSAASAPGRSQLARAFDDAHLARFGYSSPDEPVEIVNLRVRATGATKKPAFSRRPLSGRDPVAAFIGHKDVLFGAAGPPHSPCAARTALYERDRLAPGSVVEGPAIVFQLDCTTVVPPRWTGSVDEWGNLLLQGSA